MYALQGVSGFASRSNVPLSQTNGTAVVATPPVPPAGRVTVDPVPPAMVSAPPELKLETPPGELDPPVTDPLAPPIALDPPTLV